MSDRSLSEVLSSTQGRVFVIVSSVTGGGNLKGHIFEPDSARHAPFDGPTELCSLLCGWLGLGGDPGRLSQAARPGGIDPDEAGR